MSVINKNFRLPSEKVNLLLEIQGYYQEETKGLRIPGRKYSQAEIIAHLITEEHGRLFQSKDETAATKPKKLNSNMESLISEGKRRV